MPVKVEGIKKILSIRNDRFGEFLLIIPALRALKESYPESELTIAVNADVRELADCIEFADKVEIWDDDFRKSLRKHRFDACIAFNPTKEAHKAGFLARIPVRVGYDRKWGVLLNYKMPDNKCLGLKHEVEHNLELVGMIGAKTDDKILSLGRLPEYNNPEYAGAVAIHPYTSDAVKQWPVEKFRQLARLLSGELKVRVLIVGKGSGTEGKEFDNLGSNVINLINKTSLVELGQILKICKLLISCDSGPVHLAAAVGTPVIALFRNDLAGKTAKRWGPWGRGHIVLEKNNLLDITVDDVFEKIKGVLR